MQDCIDATMVLGFMITYECVCLPVICGAPRRQHECGYTANIFLGMEDTSGKSRMFHKGWNFVTSGKLAGQRITLLSICASFTFSACEKIVKLLLRVAGVYPLAMMTSSNGNIFRVTGHFLRGIHRSPVNSLHKGQWRGALMFSLICAWRNAWINNCEAGDLRPHRAHYDVTVMHNV